MSENVCWSDAPTEMILSDSTCNIPEFAAPCFRTLGVNSAPLCVVTGILYADKLTELPIKEINFD